MGGDDAYWMRLALEQAELGRLQGEIPVGAVLVRPSAEGQSSDLVAKGFNQSITLHDPTAHAEVVVLRAAGQRAENYRLPGATVYVTLEPCAMCAMALLHARVGRVVFAASDPKTGAAGSLVDLFADKRLNHQTEVRSGVLAAEAAQLLRSFFRERRDRSSGQSQ